MSPYEPISQVIGTQAFDEDEYSYHSQRDLDSDSSDAGFSSDSDGAPIIIVDEKQENAAIDAQRTLLSRKYHESAHQARDLCNQANEAQFAPRYANFNRSPVPSFPKQLACSPPSEWSACSSHDPQGEHSHQRAPSGTAHQGPSAKPSRRATTPNRSEQSQYSREYATGSSLQKTSLESSDRFAANLAWRPLSTIDRSKTVDTLTSFMEHGVGISIDKLRGTEGAGNGKPTQFEPLGCEYRVW